VDADAEIGAASARAVPRTPVTVIAATLTRVRDVADHWNPSPVCGLLWLNTAGTFLILADEEARETVGADPSMKR
jgi:hypothetical protein